MFKYFWIILVVSWKSYLTIVRDQAIELTYLFLAIAIAAISFSSLPIIAIKTSPLLGFEIAIRYLSVWFAIMGIKHMAMSTSVFQVLSAGVLFFTSALLVEVFWFMICKGVGTLSSYES